MNTVGAGAGVPGVDRGVELDARVAAQMGGFGHLSQQLASPEGSNPLASGDGSGGPFLILLNRPHELVGHSDAVVRVLEKHGAVGLPLEGRVIPRLDQGPRLLLFVSLAADESLDVGMVGIENDHLGGPPGRSARLDRAGKGIPAPHETQRSGRYPATREPLLAASDGGQVGSRAGAGLEQPALCLRQFKDGFHGVLDRVDEAGRTLGFGHHPKVEPDGAVKRSHLIDQQRPQFGPKRGSVRLGLEMALLPTPLVEGIDHSRDDLPDADLARFVLPHPAEVLRRDHVGRQHGPALGNFDVLLLKDDLTGSIRDAGRALVPLHPVEGVLPGNREAPAKLKIDGDRLALRGFCRRHGALLGCVPSIEFDLKERKFGRGATPWPYSGTFSIMRIDGR